ncbi:hypothetical protein AVEN_11528-1 [Araneus ventricosus]|uniref:Uncharacterized protein n=1 Tax=Araneus ventricosus TaxID=182803 RepID=A0A4Y2H160_ARAVE|nr:hypothetical protein AVEN_11528-1 [Araneus ventricosus]
MVQQAIHKPFLTNVNAKFLLKWCHHHKTWSRDAWKKVIWSDTSSLPFFPTTEVYTSGEHLQKFSASSISTLERQITGRDCVDILLSQLYPEVQTLFPSGDAVSQNDNCPTHTVHLPRRGVKSLKIKPHISLSHPTLPTSGLLNY